MTLSALRQGTGPAGGLVRAVQPGSPAFQAGIRPGDRIVAIDGHPVVDVIDYHLRTAARRTVVLVESNGGQRTLQLTGSDLDSGVEFTQLTFDGVRHCNNRCFFCIIGGLPSGLRRSLYVRDDDYRLSFACGTSVTLTNLAEADWRRLEAQRLSPLRVSVHATDPALRRRLLGNPEAPDVMPQLHRLGELGIEVQAQVVLCPGLNDGPALDRTLGDLTGLYPTVRSVAVVPAGATALAEARRNGLLTVAPCTPEYARAVVRQVRGWQRRLRPRTGLPVVYLADELYLMADYPIPTAAGYGGYPQLESGVGLTRLLLDDWRRTRRRLLRARQPRPRRITLVSGTLVAPLLWDIADEFERITGVESVVVPVESRFFGGRISVSGLLVARDILSALRGRSLGEIVFLPRDALDPPGVRFLDDVPAAALQRALGTRLAFVRTMSEVARHLYSRASPAGWGLSPAGTRLAKPAANGGRAEPCAG